MDHIILTGFMGAGKTTLGRALAAQLAIGFLDLDAVIEARSQRSVRELFLEQGEPAFRALEQQLLREVLSRGPLVLATGGGTLAQPGGMELARKHGVVVWVKAPVKTLFERVLGDPARPLAQRGPEAFAALYAQREPVYEQAHLHVNTERRSVSEVVAELVPLLREYSGAGRLRKRLEVSVEQADSVLHIPLGERAYDIQLGSGVLERVGERLRALFPQARKVAVLTNPVVGGFYFEPLQRVLEASGWHIVRYDMPDGEQAKSLSELTRLLDFLAEHRFERKEPLLALGGGVVGDAAGFAAAVYLRGVPFVQVPTTLLSQVDSSVGGKTGVNVPFGKNLVGAFYQPREVLIDVLTLQTLPEREFKAGLAEVIKYGVIRDLAFFEWLEREVASVRAQDHTALLNIIYRSCLNKAEVVVNDEREEGERALLNFGHTLGHAFETLGAYHGLKHGEAVALGMRFAAFLSHSLGYCSEQTLTRLERLLDLYGLEYALPSRDADACLEVMTRDKKVSRGQVKFIMVEAVGCARIVPVSFETLRPVLQAFLARAPE